MKNYNFVVFFEYVTVTAGDYWVITNFTYPQTNYK